MNLEIVKQAMKENRLQCTHVDWLVRRVELLEEAMKPEYVEPLENDRYLVMTRPVREYMFTLRNACEEYREALKLTGYRLLVARFRHMAEVRLQMALELREKGDRSFIGQETSANAYNRCADELLTCLDGKTPPPVGEQWPDADGALVEMVEPSHAN